MTETITKPSTADKQYWRSLEQLADSPEFRASLHREFPEGIADGPGFADEVSRRNFLGVIAASIALAGMTSCRKPAREILPFNHRPAGWTPGLPNYYATSLGLGGYGFGAVVRSNEGRPTKVEGNPLHPSSRGGTNAFMQAEVLNLYDPGRSQRVRRAGSGDTSLAAFHDGFWKSRVGQLAAKEGDGLHVLMSPSTSPTLARMVNELRSALPKAAVHSWSPVSRDNEIAASRLAFGVAVDAHYAFSAARVVASFDSDFLGLDNRSLGWVRDYAAARKITTETGSVSRLYVAEAGFSLTGSNADHRFRLPSSQIAAALFALALELGVASGDAALERALSPYANRRFEHRGKNWIAALAADLRANAGRGIVLVGERQPAAVQAIGHAINLALGNVGASVGERPIWFTRTADGVAGGASLAALTAAMSDGRVDTLVCLGTNPVYDAPADLDFATALKRVPNKIHLGQHVDETAQLCDWHVPAASELESWGDLLAYDGTAGIVQPLIAPLHGGVSAIEFLAQLVQLDTTDGYELVRKTWQDSSAFAAAATDGFDAWWNRCLHDGVVSGTAATAIAAPSLATSAIADAVRAVPVAPAPTSASLEIDFRPCPTVFDGRYSNNAWQQELPTSLEKLSWDNAVLMSRRTAEALGVGNRDVVTLNFNGRGVDGAVWISPGMAENTVTVTLGYGRRLGDECKVAKGAGFDAYRMRSQAHLHFGSGLTVTRTGQTYKLVTTQDHGSLEGRPLVREATLDEYRTDPRFAELASPLAQAAAIKGKRETDLLESLWQERDYSTGYQWGMVIDLNSCTGCNACVVACVAENNIPMVGKDQVEVGREMFWNRLDRYYAGGADQAGVALDEDPQVVHQMVPCMQCENAPCESVCPVAATVHSPEGLNDMAYNRCIGTRYCSNNCPYKVRRFNWFNFHKDFTPGDTRSMQFNPDVTVRSRGVMEKCTYCVQRINGAKFRAKLDDRRVSDADLQTACQQGCPADAIAFGNILDPESRVSKWRASNLNYAMLSELNAKPRTTYLAKIRNPNPELS